MELYQRKRIPLLLLSVCIVFSVVFAVVLASDCYEHDCTGEDCPVCLHIETAQSILKTLKLAGIGLIPTACLISYTYVDIKHTEWYPCLLSPVMLKVRFNS